MAEVVLPELKDGKKVVLFFSGGVNSTLLAYLAKQKYGVSNIIPLFSGFAPVRQIEALANSDIPTDIIKKQRAQRILANRISDFQKMYDELQLENAIILDSIEKFNFDIHNLIGDMHRVNYIEAITYILVENFGYKPEDIQCIMMGHEKLDNEIYELNELDAKDGIINNINIDEITQHVEDNPEQFTEVIKHNVLSRWAEWSYQNSYYKMDHAQYTDMAETFGILPFQFISKSEIVQMYHDLGLDDLLNNTVSCHSGPNHPLPCGTCVACVEREIALNNVSTNSSNITP